MAGFWSVRFTREEKERLEREWLERVATMKAHGRWPPPWPKMTDERLEQRRKRLEKKYGKLYKGVNDTSSKRD